MPQDWNYGTERLGGASMALGSGRRGFERYGLFSTTVREPCYTGASRLSCSGENSACTLSPHLQNEPAAKAEEATPSLKSDFYCIVTVICVANCTFPELAMTLTV